MLFPCNARINFLSIHQIIERRKEVSTDIPGIITSNIDAVAATHHAQQMRYELCLDGKRLTVVFGNKLGDVDLCGHEAKPTLAEKKSRLEIELQVITCTKGLLPWLQQAEQTAKESTQGMACVDRTMIHQKLVSMIKILSTRMKELRQNAKISVTTG